MPEIVLPDDVTDEAGLCWPYTVPPAARAEWADYDASTRAAAVESAVDTLRLLTAFTVGGCPVAVHPCRSRCGRFDPTWRAYPVAGTGLGRVAFWPVLTAGDWSNTVWLNTGDGCSSCSPLGGLRLPRSQGGVTEVAIGGVALDTAEWTVNDGILHRTDGTAWPVGTDTFTVTLYPRPQPGAAGAAAAGALAVEYARGMTPNGTRCRLPSRATQVVRNGVSVNLTTDLFPDGLTGIHEADLFIRAVNPYALRTPPVVWSPDLAGR